MSTPPSWLPTPEPSGSDPFASPVSNGYEALLPGGAPPPVAHPVDAPAPGAGPYAAPGPADPQYGAGDFYARPTNGLAIASLVTSLASLVVGISAPVGLILGIFALRAIRRDGTGGRGLAIGGIVVGALVTLLIVAFVVIAIVASTMFAATSGTAGLST